MAIEGTMRQRSKIGYNTVITTSDNSILSECEAGFELFKIKSESGNIL